MAASTSTSRLVKGTRPVPPAPSRPADPFSTPAFTQFKIVNPDQKPVRLQAAWLAAKGDTNEATRLVEDMTWNPEPSAALGKASPKRPAADVGKVPEIAERLKAQRAEKKEKAQRSAIYAKRAALDTVHGSPKTPAPTKRRIDSIDIPDSPDSPTVNIRAKRARTTQIVSDSEGDDDDVVEVLSSSGRKASPVKLDPESQTLKYLNTKDRAALQELTGCTPTQADAIVELRPYTSTADIKGKWGKGKKKPGPAGLSQRMLEDSIAIFEGYEAVDDVLLECEKIGASLNRVIQSWSASVYTKGKQKEGSSTPSDRDGSLSLRAVSKHTKAKDYLTTQPKLISKGVQLKEYQLMGVNWLNLMYTKSLSCILADEMGLGKTIQVIGFLAHLKQRGVRGPYLIVVPSSTLENWCREFDRFAPSLSVQTYYAGKDERPRLRETLVSTVRSDEYEDGWEVLITTYNLAQGDGKDRKFFKRLGHKSEDKMAFKWECCVFDEGHVLKNFQSQRYQTLLQIPSKWKLLLTGTPLQNNLQELVVLSDLPKKNERIHWCDMTDLQKSIYRDALQRSRKTIFDVEKTTVSQGEVGSDGRKPAKKKSRTNTREKDKLYVENSTNVLMDLRKAASHPMLFRTKFTDDTLSKIAKQLIKEPDYVARKARFDHVREDMTVMTDSELQALRKFQQDDACFLEAGKVQALLELLQKYRKQSRKVLIFSQFTQVLDILQEVLNQKQIKFLLLTGSTPVDVRQSLVDEFAEDDSVDLFLLSTKAGGMGINLTAASVVILFDQDFNPHNDRQAQDRAYRIGQKRDVDVIKLIAKGTIEEDILRLGQTKLALDEAVAGDGDSDEGESVQEKEMRTSLMKALRQQLDKEPTASPEKKDTSLTTSSAAETETRSPSRSTTHTSVEPAKPSRNKSRTMALLDDDEELTDLESSDSDSA
ncbi:hypothetical protein FISHEDRAFT_46591 [Fistulina hepatica ATCC 64428]|uniref:SNF2 family DNA-dependent ATPase n=1 Tax=Fistulina hepatica ATCC 64428 TaxID=1128425 RepID=A0A0D7A7M8_9AGAR|nr:hypothetical protein FISHEDRAFT_46591 [Fistulina hepatica ATCC 64428]